MKKHKKILKNFNFKKMVDNANFKDGELNQRIERFKYLKSLNGRFDGDWKLFFDKQNYCFKVVDITGYEKAAIEANRDQFTTQATKKYIGDYLYKINKVSSFIKNRWIK